VGIREEGDPGVTRTRSETSKMKGAVLAVRVTEKGVKTFVLQKKIRGRAHCHWQRVTNAPRLNLGPCRRNEK
jgi:hypothetical protein